MGAITELAAQLNRPQTETICIDREALTVVQENSALRERNAMLEKQNRALENALVNMQQHAAQLELCLCAWVGFADRVNQLANEKRQATERRLPGGFLEV